MNVVMLFSICLYWCGKSFVCVCVCVCACMKTLPTRVEKHPFFRLMLDVAGSGEGDRDEWMVEEGWWKRL